MYERCSICSDECRCLSPAPLEAARSTGEGDIPREGAGSKGISRGSGAAESRLRGGSVRNVESLLDLSPGTMTPGGLLAAVEAAELAAAALLTLAACPGEADLGILPALLFKGEPCPGEHGLRTFVRTRATGSDGEAAGVGRATFGGGSGGCTIHCIM